MSSLTKPVLSNSVQESTPAVSEQVEHQEKAPEKPRIHYEGDIKILKTVELSCDGMCCRFSDDGDKLAVGLSNGDIKIYKGSTGACIYHLADDDTKANRLPVTSLNFIPAAKTNRGELLIATYASGAVKYWHIGTSKALKTLHESFQLLTSSLSQSTAHLVVGGSSTDVLVFDVETGKKVAVCAPSENRHEMDGHRSRIFCVKHHPHQEHVFLSGGWDDTVQIWDHRESHALRRIFGPHICGDGIDIDVKYDHILTSSWRRENVLQVWDFETGEKIKTIPSDFKNDTCLYCGQWLGRSHMICGGSDENVIRIVNKETLATSGMLYNLPSGVYSIDHDRHRLLHHQHRGNDVTMITAVAGSNLYFISNAVRITKREE